MNKHSEASVAQKVLGIVTIVAGAVSVPLLDMDITGAILMVPLGLFLLLAKDDLFKIQ